VADSTDARTDEELLAAARVGNSEALETLILRYQPRVYRFGVKMCSDVEDAADVLQETLLAMTRTVRNFRGDSTVSTWLYTIARSFCIKKRRRGKFAPAEQSLEALRARDYEDPSDPAPGPEQAAWGREIERALSAAIDSLDPAQREVLVLRDVEGLSAPEVAAVLGLRLEAVKSRLHRARLTVRQRIAPVLGIPEAARPQSRRCPDVLMLFSRHLEGEIGPELCAEMEAHLEHCGPCRGSCESLKRTLALCGAIPASDVPASVAESVRDAIRTYLAQQTT
jgi:RNA polymerase sigma-70 factor (ECF subfamily)